MARRKFLFSPHNHTHYSNIRLLDSIIRPKDLVKKAIEKGLDGIAITDHECIASHIEFNQLAEKYAKTHPDFKIALGNEIYLIEERGKVGQKLYHFILIAKDEIGHRQLRELSSKAWLNSYTMNGMERVPLLKRELRKIIGEEKGHLIATTACLGGELACLIRELILVEQSSLASLTDINRQKQEIVNTLREFVDIFGDDFFIEVAPGDSEEQVVVNRRAYQIAGALGIKVIAGSDSHYLGKEDRPIHKAYLNSKPGDREVDGFYEYSYLMSREETVELLGSSFMFEIAESICDNSKLIYDKIEHYSLAKEQIIPLVKVKDYPKRFLNTEEYPSISWFLQSNSVQDRYWINACLGELQAKGLYNETYLKRIDTEADVVHFISERLGQSLSAYFNTLQSYINLFWRCGSILGPGRGSAVGFLTNYLLGITQLDPVEWNLPYWRFLNKERAEMPRMLGM